MPIFAVHYTYTDATVAGRDEHRPAHRDWLRGLVDAGIVLSSGAYLDGTGALILISQPDLDAARTLLTADPFALAGVVDGVRVVQWTPVMGAFSSNLSPMGADKIIDAIDELVAEEHELRARVVGTGLSDRERTRLAALEVQLDQCWDLLRQRRARSEFGDDPDQAQTRSPRDVQGYRQ